VMPQFQGSLDPGPDSNEWARSNRKTVFGPNVEAVRRAFTDSGRAVPEEYRARTVGARDVPEGSSGAERHAGPAVFLGGLGDPARRRWARVLATSLLGQPWGASLAPLVPMRR